VFFQKNVKIKNTLGVPVGPQVCDPLGSSEDPPLGILRVKHHQHSSITAADWILMFTQNNK